ncbi:MAG TPA: M1 family aminopeptidase, partial [Bacteroidales bacterium]|nr:M1 family aminopeptidase [Bacteroidales bacterium]
VGSSMGGVARIYQKGSLVLGMLRNVMGDEEFRYAVKKYLVEHPYKNALQEDFFRDVYEAGGKSYQWFFDEWILHGGEPNYKVTWSVKDDTLGNRSTCMQVWQVHETNNLVGLFRMPIQIDVYYKDGSLVSVKPVIGNKFHEITIPNPDKKPVSFILFDPGRNVLKSVTFVKSFDELSAQAMKAKNMIDRYDAFVALRTMPLNEKRSLLLACYPNEKFHLNRAEIIDQLSADRMDIALELFRNALKDPDALVRKAVLKSVSPVPPSLKTEFEEALNDFSYLNQELALQNLCKSFPENISSYLEKTKEMKGWRGMNIRMKWLDIAITQGEKKYLPELIGYTGPQYEFETRINALNVLKKLLYMDSVTMKNAVQASDHWNNKLATAGKEYLKTFNQE